MVSFTNHSPDRRKFLMMATAIAAAGLIPGELLYAASHRKFSPRDGKADYIFQGGTVYTVNLNQPLAEAVAIRGGTIVYVGDVHNVSAWKGSGTEVINLGDGMLLPGFVDAHCHPEAAITKLGVNVVGLDKDKALDEIKKYVDLQPGKEPLKGFGWNAGNMKPRREWLDAITGDRPMYLLSADAHDLWFNTAAMKAAGVSASTPDPVPLTQYFVRDPDKTPTGHAVEAAAVMMIAIPLGIFSPEGIRESQKLMLDPAPSWGITSLFNAGITAGSRSEDAEWIYQELIKRDLEGKLPVRIRGCVWTRDGKNDPKAIAANLTDWSKRLKSNHLKIDVCKVWSDGTLLSGGALLLEPFVDRPGNGRMTFKPEEIVAQIEAAHRAGFDMHIHVEADGSARVVLDSIEKVQKKLGRGNFRDCVTHNSLLSPQDVPRYKQMGIIANCQPMWGTDYNGESIDVYTKALGAKRVEERAFPYGDLVRSGATVTYGSDVPGIEIPDIPPLINLQAAITRKRPGYPNDRVFNVRQAVTLEQALRCYTINGAYQLRLEKEAGSIEVGKRADLTMLGKNIFKVQPEEIYKTPVLFTMMDGVVTHTKL